MPQVLFIHGGNSHNSQAQYIDDLKSLKLNYERLKYHMRWSAWISENLPKEYDSLTPTFPNGYNAQYDEWVIYFEKILPFLDDCFTIVGHSLGAMFIAKYLHSHILPIHAKQIILISGQYGGGGSFVVNSATGLERSADEIHLFHSEDDPVVPYESLDKFAKDLPSAVIHRYSDKAHFNESTFPDLLDLIKQK